jgi:hypothetical protein
MNLVDQLILPAMYCRGPMSNKDIYDAVKRKARKRGKRLTPHWRATVRNTLQRHAKGHPKCTERVLFIHLDRALWKARR